MHIHVRLFAHFLHTPHILCTCKESPTIPSYFLLDAFTKSSPLCKLFFSDTLWALVWTFFWAFFAHSLHIHCSWKECATGASCFKDPIHILCTFISYFCHIFANSHDTLDILPMQGICTFFAYSSHTLPTLFGHSLHMEGMCNWSLLHILCIYFAQSFHIFIKSCRIFRTCKECGRSVQWEFFACIKFLTTNP